MYVPLPFCPGSAFLPPALTMFILCHRTKQDLTQLKSLTRATTCRSNSAARLGLSRSRTLSVPAPRSAPSLATVAYGEIGEGVVEAAGFQFWGIGLAKPPFG